MIAEVDPVAEMPKSLPEPDRATVMGAARFEAEMVRVPVAGPAVVGVKVTLSWQFAPTASDEGQLLPDTAKPLVTTAARLVSA